MFFRHALAYVTVTVHSFKSLVLFGEIGYCRYDIEKLADMFPFFYFLRQIRRD